MSVRTSDRLLLILSRAPVPGETKTRLGQTVGMERAAALHRAFLRDYACRFTPATGPDTFQLGWAFTPAECDFRGVVAGLAPEFDLSAVRFVPQAGATFGERQANLLRWGREQGYRSTVLIGSDSPQTRVETVLEAFALLETHDLVTGLVQEGGYWIIGVNDAHDVVAGIPMSTGREAQALVEGARARGLRAALVAPSFDVDVEDDLALLIAALEPDGADAPATWAALAELGLRPG